MVALYQTYDTEFQPKTNESIHRDAPSALKIVLNSQAASEPEIDSEPEKLDPQNIPFAISGS